MPAITCQYTGIEFEAKSARTKNHPAVSDLLTRANKLNQYPAAVEALNAAREAGVTEINEFLSLAESAMKADRAAYNAKLVEIRAELKRRAQESADHYLNRRWLDRADDSDIATEMTPAEQGSVDRRNALIGEPEYFG